MQAYVTSKRGKWLQRQKEKVIWSGFKETT
jgi:hypothetical protein